MSVVGIATREDVLQGRLMSNVLKMRLLVWLLANARAALTFVESVHLKQIMVCRKNFPPCSRTFPTHEMKDNGLRISIVSFFSGLGTKRFFTVSECGLYPSTY